MEAEWAKALSKNTWIPLEAEHIFYILIFPIKNEPIGLGISSDQWITMNETRVIKEHQSFGCCYGVSGCVPLKLMLKS